MLPLRVVSSSRKNQINLLFRHDGRLLSGLDPAVPAAGAALSSASHPFSWPLCTLGDVPVGLEAAPRASNGGFLSPHCSSLPARFGGVHHFLLQAEPSQQVVRIINQLIVHIQKRMC